MSLADTVPGSGDGRSWAARERVPFLLYRASEISHSLASEMLAGIALSARQAGILTMVTELEPMTQKALGDALGIE